MKRIISVIAVLLLSCGTAFAKPQTYTATGEYVMSPKETLETGIQHAREDALRLISESVGVYVESQSEAKNQELTQDEIRTMSSNIIRVKSESAPTIVQHGQGLDIKLTVTAEADADELFNEQKKKNNELELQNANLQCDADMANIDAASAFDRECFAYNVYAAYDLLGSSAKAAAKSQNSWTQAYAKKWLGVAAFYEGRYDEGLKLCEESVDRLVHLEEEKTLGIGEDSVHLMYEIADACIYYCMDVDRAEKYLKKADALQNRCIERWYTLDEDPEQHVRKCIESIRSGEKTVSYEYTTNELIVSKK